MTNKAIKEEIENIAQQIIKKYQPEKIILFGSVARGDFGQESDFDFLIIKNDKRARIERMQTVYSLIEKRVPADFLVYTPGEVKERLRLGDPFLKTVFREGKVLYG